MAASWTLKKELCGLSKARSLNEALCTLGLIQDPDEPFTLEQLHEWRRGSAETYTYRFKVIGAGTERDVLLKAITAFSTSKSLNQIVEEWAARQRLLTDAGIRTPVLYFAGHALLMEQYVGEKLSDWLQHHPIADCRLTDQVFRIAATIDRHGFSPVRAFTSLRTDGTSVYMVDFGADLGPPGVRRRCSNRLFAEAKRWLVNVSNQDIDPVRAEAVYRFYFEAEERHDQKHFSARHGEGNH